MQSNSPATSVRPNHRGLHHTLPQIQRGAEAVHEPSADPGGGLGDRILQVTSARNAVSSSVGPYW